MRLLLFFVLSAAAWLFVALQDTYETQLKYQLRVDGVPDSVIVTDEPPRTIMLSVRGKGLELALFNISRALGLREASSTDTVKIPFNDYRTNNNHVVIKTAKLIADYASNEQKQRISLPVKSEVLNVSPNVIEYYYCMGEQKRVPVRINIDMLMQKGYVGVDTIVEPLDVVAFAPQSILNRLSIAETAFTTISDISDTLNKTIKLAYVKGVKFIPNKVRLHIPVDVLVEKTLSVSVRGINIPQDYALRCFPAQVDVRFQTPAHHQINVKPEDFDIVVDYEQTPPNATTCSPYIVKSPQGIYYAQLADSREIDFLIEKMHTAR